ncbi:MAG: efflux RND transporter permease subunit [Deltaproteobacteria bacterium]|nr:efflux RND transporter permease subunit [Deltaproteobacteria bacterium]
MKKLLTAFAGNRVFANILLILILLSGWIASQSMIRESMPEMALDMIQISVTYPGSHPEEIEEGISLKIEESLDGLEGIKQLTTYSSETRSTTIIEVAQGYDANEVMDRIRSQVDAISSFPLDAERPIINELTVHRQVMSLTLTSDMPEHRLKVWAEQIKQEIQALPEITQVSLFGTRDYEIHIEVSEERLREYGLTFSQVINAIRQSNLNMAGGTIRTQEEEIRILTIGRKYTGEDLSSIIVMARPEGEVITLDRLATIKDGFVEYFTSNLVDGQRAITLNIYNTPDEDALTISRAVKNYLQVKEALLPEGTSIEILYDSTDMLRSRIDLLIKNGLIGLVVVFLLLWVFMDTRVAFWTGMGIPLSIAGAMVVLWAIDGTINMLSLFAFIMVLGIVVDDAIVVGEAIFVHREKGLPPLKAAVNGVSEVGMPVIAAVITTIVAFLPLTMTGGILGKFIFILPVVVIACLAVSLLESLLLLPAHLNHLPDLNDFTVKSAGLRKMYSTKNLLPSLQRFTSQGMETFVNKVYQPFLKKVLQWRYVSTCVGISILLLTVGFINAGMVKFTMFPKVDGITISSTLKFPDGTPMAVTQEAVNRVEAALTRLADRTKTLSGEPLLEHTNAITGMTFESEASRGPQYGAVLAILLDPEKRGIHSEDIMAQWEAEIGPIPGIESLTFETESHGPPGSPIEIWVQGEDMSMILNAADELKNRLQEFIGVYQVCSDFNMGKNEIRLTLKPQASGLGITVDDLAQQVRAGFYGSEALRLQRGQDEIRVMVRYTDQERSQISDLRNVRIRTPNGHEVPLFSVADITYSPGYSTITRTDGTRRVMVSAKVDTNMTNTREIIKELSSGYFGELKNRYPDLKLSVRGDQKNTQETFGSLYIGFPLAIIGIFIIIATVFRSYIQPFIILITVPFGIIGATLGHSVLGYDLTMISIFGMVALAGVVVNDAIVLIDCINRNLARGMYFLDAVQLGGARRFRAIILTTISTVGGLTPLILETDLQAKMLIPMAISIAAGVIFATVLTLLLIPSLLLILNDLRRIFHGIWYGRWPTREEVEPASSQYIHGQFGKYSDVESPILGS